MTVNLTAQSLGPPPYTCEICGRVGSRQYTIRFGLVSCLKGKQCSIRRRQQIKHQKPVIIPRKECKLTTRVFPTDAVVVC